MKFSLLLFLCCMALLPASAQQSKAYSNLLDSRFFSLKGKEGKTTVVNATNDTIKLKAQFFNWMPYAEAAYNLSIAPGEKQVITASYNFPDFWFIDNSRFVIYNGPGGDLLCTVKQWNNKGVDISYSGDFAQENRYYLPYCKFLGNYDAESRSFYTISDQLKDWNLFPARADSITKVRTNFLKQYTAPLPAGFKTYEYQRLQYNQYFRLYNALLAKEFHSGHAVPVNAGYFNFEHDLLHPGAMLFNQSCLAASELYQFRQSKQRKQQAGRDAMLDVIDSLYPHDAQGDVFKVVRLGKIYTHSKPKFDSVFTAVKFTAPELKSWYESLVQSRYGLPRIGHKPPQLKLTDLSGKAVALSDFTGQNVIVNFWAVWCQPCIEEFDRENQIYKQYKDKGLTVVNICVDSDPEQWKRMGTLHQLNMVNLYMPKQAYTYLLNVYQVSSLPRSLFINSKGIVTDNYLKRASQLTAEDITRLIQP